MTRLLRLAAAVLLVALLGGTGQPASAGTGGGSFTGTLVVSPRLQFALTGAPAVGTWYLRGSGSGSHPTAGALALDVVGNFGGTCENWSADEGQGRADVDGSSHSLTDLEGQAAGFHLVLTAPGPHGGTVVVDAHLAEDPLSGGSCQTSGETSFLATGTVSWT